MTTTAMAQTAKTGQIHKTVTTAGTPLALSSTDLYVRRVLLQCSGANTGTTCFAGTSAANAVAAKGIVMAKPTATAEAQPVVLEVGPGEAKINLKEIYVDVATNADEVNAFYIE